MKKIALLFGIVLGTASVVSAQTMYDALTFSETDYYGTARSLALGNAMTAIGGDLGSIGINPAGSAVNSFSTFSFTPGLSKVTTSSSVDGNAGTTDGKTRFMFPNSGFVLNFDTGNRRGVTRLSMGFLVSGTSNHLNRQNAFISGNSKTSMLGSFAAGATGIKYDDLLVNDPYNSTSYPWNTVMAANSGMIATFDGKTDEWLGATEMIDGEGYISVAGPLYQRSTVESKGSMNDVIMNAGLDINDKLFLGLNIGIPTMNYSYNEVFVETAKNPSDFLIEYDDGTSTYFKNSRYEYGYRASVSGIYAKLGVIAVPFKNFRIGAAIKTPTAMTIEEQWQVSGKINYADGSNSSSTSPAGEWAYNFRSPFEANFGAALTLGSFGFISADYELTDFSVMKYSEMSFDEFSSSADPYYVVNRLNKLFCGVQHSLRLGVEVKPVPSFAFRAGYTMMTSPLRVWTDDMGLKVDAAEYEAYFDEFENGVYNLVSSETSGYTKNSISLGFGYSSPGSFFADFAFRYYDAATSDMKPYADYIFDDKGAVEVASPTIGTKRSLVDALFTFGWRF